MFPLITNSLLLFIAGSPVYAASGPQVDQTPAIKIDRDSDNPYYMGSIKKDEPTDINGDSKICNPDGEAEYSYASQMTYSSDINYDQEGKGRVSFPGSHHSNTSSELESENPYYATNIALSEKPCSKRISNGKTESEETYSEAITTHEDKQRKEGQFLRAQEDSATENPIYEGEFSLINSVSSEGNFISVNPCYGEIGTPEFSRDIHHKTKRSVYNHRRAAYEEINVTQPDFAKFKGTAFEENHNPALFDLGLDNQVYCASLPLHQFDDNVNLMSNPLYDDSYSLAKVNAIEPS